MCTGFFPSFSVPSCAIYMYVQQYWVVIRFCYSSFFFLLSFCLLSAFFSVWILYLTALRLSQKNEKAPLHNTCLCVMCAWTNAHARISHLTIRLINCDFFFFVEPKLQICSNAHRRPRNTLCTSWSFITFWLFSDNQSKKNSRQWQSNLYGLDALRFDQIIRGEIVCSRLFLGW